jgi:UDP-N-acetylmuramoylalanine--D-glutamate ligase
MRVLLLGLGRANLPVAEYLIKKGEQVFVYDENIQNLSQAALSMINNRQVHLYVDNSYDLVVTSPGFPPNRPVCKTLASKGVSVIDEIEFVYRQLDDPKIIAVTGTNGKSTTAALISNILSEAGVDNFLGGNIAPGRPFSRTLFLERFRCYVLEVSSFQLLRIERFHPHIAVLTNIGIDHLNWHRNVDEYKEAKLRIFVNQGNDDFAVLNYDDNWVRAVSERVRSHAVFFGFHTNKGVSIDGKFRYDESTLFSSDIIPLPGKHNLMNIAAAVAVCKIMKLDNADIERGVQSFKGLPHRLEDLGEIGGVRYVNNSMCTNATAAIASFEAVTGPKIVILGGKHKGDEGEGYFDVLIKNAKACVILGENASFIVHYFKKHGFERYAVAMNMDDAVHKARDFSVPGDIVILNPGFASFDFFGNFEERGEAFRYAVQQG